MTTGIHIASASVSQIGHQTISASIAAHNENHIAKEVANILLVQEYEQHIWNESKSLIDFVWSYLSRS